MKKIKLISMSLLAIFFLSGCNVLNQKEDNRYTATVESDSYNIAAEIGGRLKLINLVQGQNVKQGAKVAELDTKFYELQKKQAEIALKYSKLKKEDLPNKATDNMKKQVDNGIDASQNAVDLAQLQIDKASIKSEFSGVVTEVFVNIGEMVTPGMNIAKITNNSEKFAEIYVEESKRHEVKLGQELGIYFNEKQIGKGKIIVISEVSEFTPKNTETKSGKEKTVFKVKFSLANNEKIVPGMMVDVLTKVGD